MNGSSVIPAFGRLRQEEYQVDAGLHNEICVWKKKRKRKREKGREGGRKNGSMG